MAYVEKLNSGNATTSRCDPKVAFDDFNQWLKDERLKVGKIIDNQYYLSSLVGEEEDDDPVCKAM